MKRWPTGLALVAIAVATALVMSCAEERDPINRVQPNVIKKTMLDGEWYFHQKIIDVPGGLLQGMFYPALVGWYADPERVRFEVQENFLYVRRVREIVDGAETYNRPYDPDFSSYAVLATFRIMTHFDIQRDYNPVTGESMNVVSENMYDRPWWEREYMRVDWSMNLTPGFWGQTWMMTLAPQDPTPFYVQTDCTPDLEFAPNPEDRCVPDDKAPFFDIVWNEDGSALEKGYFDITNQYTLRPGTLYIEGYGELPACWLFGHEIEECVSAQYFLRNSFWKYIPEEHDFEAMEISGNASSQMGFFYSTVMNYDIEEQVKESSRRYYMNRHNIWEQSHDFTKQCQVAKDCCPNFDTYYNEALASMKRIEDGVDLGWWQSHTDETADYAAMRMAEAKCNSTCDILMELREDDRVVYEDENECQFRVTEADLNAQCPPVHYCTLSYNERRVRPIVYYTNAEWPEELNHRPDDPGVSDDETSRTAWKYAYADQPGETRPVNEQISDRWSAVFVRVINILKNKAAGKVSGVDFDPNTPYIDDDMRRTAPVSGVGVVSKDGRGVPTGNRGFDTEWYDAERPPFVVCRFSPVLGPQGDPDGIEPDVCWERIQENSHCVFDPENPGVDPKTGEEWVEAAEWPICAEREATPRLGDIRYSMAYWVDKWYEGFGLLGLGPGNPDLLTGETLSGSAHLYMHNDMAARRIVDATMLITGDLSEKDYIDGYNLAGWRNRFSGSGTNPENRTYSWGQIGAMGGTVYENLKLAQKLNPNIAGTPTAGTGNGLPSHNTASMSNKSKVQFLNMDQLMMNAAGSYAATPLHDDDSMIRAISTTPGGSSIEADLFNSANATTMLTANGLHYDSDISDDTIRDQVLITRSNPFKLAAARDKFKEKLTVEMKADFEDSSAESASISLAYEVQRLRREGRLPAENSDAFRNGLWRLARKKLMQAVTTHEIGHSLGLRHNFGGSQDSMNYKEEYWDIRTHGCADVAYDNLGPDVSNWQSEPSWNEANGCGNENPQIGPRYLRYEPDKPWSGDPLSKYEMYKKLYHKAYTSIMDYAGTYHIDEDGLGRYDYAVMLYGYGHHFEVFKDWPAKGVEGQDWHWRAHDSLVPGIVTEDAPDANTIIDAVAKFEGDDLVELRAIEPGALVVNLLTGEETTVASVVDGTTLTTTTPFATPLKKGDKYAVWGPPLYFNSESMASFDGLLAQLSFDDYIKFYQMQYGNMYMPLTIAFVAPHYTMWPRNWARDPSQGLDFGFNKQSNRDVRDIRDFDWRVYSQDGDMYVPGFYLNNQPVADGMRVPYTYCTDNRVNISSDCRTRDYGADDWERMDNILKDWDYWYISRSFIRQRNGFMPQDYPGAYYGRYYRVPKQFNDIYALYTELLWSGYHERTAMAMFIDPWNMWGGTTLAVHDGFNMLMQTLAAPDVNLSIQFGAEYRLQDGAWALASNPYTKQQGGQYGNIGFDIAQGARVFETQYSNFDRDANCGVDFFRCLWNIGWYYDKIMALNGLSESSTFFVSRDTAVDVRQFRISFFDNFNWQIKRFFSAMMGEDWADWAPVTVTEKTKDSYGAMGVLYPMLYADMILPVAEPSDSFYPLKQPKMFFRNWANPAGDITRDGVYQNAIRDLVNDDGMASAINETEVTRFTTADAEALIAKIEDGEAEWTPIDPNFGFTTQVYAMVLGMSRFQHNYDISFYNSGRMWTKAGEEPLTEEPGDEIETDGGVDDNAGRSLAETNNIVSYYDPENALLYKAVESYRPNDVLHPYETNATEGVGVGASMLMLANKIKARSHDCDPIAGPDAHFTRSTADDCCDDVYAEDYPLTETTADDCLEEFGDSNFFYYKCSEKSESDRAGCIDDEEGNVDKDGDLLSWAVDENGDRMVKEYLWDNARSAVELRKMKADEYLKRYRGILDFQVRLTNVFDVYMGFVGDEYDPGNTPAE